MKRTIRDQGFDRLSMGQLQSFILLQIGFAWLEITFSPGGRGKVNSIQAGECKAICVSAHREYYALY